MYSALYDLYMYIILQILTLMTGFDVQNHIVIYLNFHLCPATVTQVLNVFFCHMSFSKYFYIVLM